MQLDPTLAETLNKALAIARPGPASAQRALQLMDLTSLNDNDTAESVTAFSRKATTPAGNVAAVCVYSRFVPAARAVLEGTGVRIATVVNFPGGFSTPDDVAAETRAALDAGADEIDVVVPVKAALAGDMAAVTDVLTACKEACGTAPMKVILESGLFSDAALLKKLSQTACAAGADFLKTSTGKVPQGASLEAAAVMLSVIADGNLGVGFKASGGVASNAQAAQYLALADTLLGPAWAGPATFRFGASRLLDALLADLGQGGAGSGASSGY